MTKAEHKRLSRIVGGRDALAGVIAFLKEKAPKRKPASSRKTEKKDKQLIKKGARADVRAACVERANGRCEACAWPATRFEMDHFYGRSRSESLETCWMLCRWCHHDKTENSPSRAYWDEKFAAHCGRYDYSFRPRLTKNISRPSPFAEKHLLPEGK